MVCRRGSREGLQVSGLSTSNPDESEETFDEPAALPGGDARDGSGQHRDREGACDGKPSDAWQTLQFVHHVTVVLD